MKRSGKIEESVLTEDSSGKFLHDTISKWLLPISRFFQTGEKKIPEIAIRERGQPWAKRALCLAGTGMPGSLIGR
jgi:hypothetical protein